MKDHQGEFAVGKMCKVFQVSRSGYYAWLNRKPSKRERENRILKSNIIELHRLSRFRLGSPMNTVIQYWEQVLPFKFGEKPIL